MSTTYSYSATGICPRTGFGIEARCIFFDGRSIVSELTLFDELEIALKQTDTLPDCVVIFAASPLIEDLYSKWIAAVDARKRFLARGDRQGIQFVKAHYFVAWDATGQNLHAVTTGEEGADIPWDIPTTVFLRQGLSRLVRDNPVVQLAPAGHVFKHPSGTINKVFIQARELATSEPQFAFVGRSLCQALGSDIFSSAAQVFVDTMSIYSFVREALNFSGNSARIQSFHSYVALAELVAPGNPYIVVISASTTGGMARRLHSEQGFENERLLTLIDTTESGRLGTVLVALDTIDDIYSEHLTDSTETEIELVGEHFSSKAKPPRTVTLGLTHRPGSLEKILKEFGLHAVMPINVIPPGKPRPKIVSLDGAAVARCTALIDWLRDEVSWRVSVAVNFVLHTDDPGSTEMAKQAAGFIDQIKGVRPEVVNYSAIRTGRLNDAHGVLVITAVAGDGGILREISRELRELIATTIPRHFLVGIGLPQSADAWARLEQFLVRNTTFRNYGFSCWHMLSVGADGSRNAWQDMADLASDAEINIRRPHLVDKSVSNASLGCLVTAIKSAAQGVLPRTDGELLSLSEGFLFFGQAFNGRLAEVQTPATFLAVASVMQRARDIKTTMGQLRPTGYESVVLAPENFLRFNDNLLQACVLRAAHAAEMDYSTDPHLSTLMKEMLLKIFERHNHPYGAAALEFAVALATGRMRLKKADTDEVVAKTVDHLANAQPSALLGCMLMIR